ncbi:probable protein phosphatase 2C 60 isoform X2 [Acanthaster planci]|uniref:protein-serine/threonine phosphatase n=1 Tax=Acanthaster planci TaxID=133434 RepID=A0A8B7YUS2_ACAPL|nr:probable protein phosphatase 2C 60 isoform X2 [Acanthaster planci]
MGAYLSEPKTECVSDDGGTEKLRFGSSAMQGWRLGMEDGHNCIPHLDDETAMFAVYDGHGGAEVAIYCSKYLPDCIVDQEAYKNGDLAKALEDAFMKIDVVLKEPAVVEELRHLAGMEHNNDEADSEEANALQEEANLPLGELLARYSYHPSKTRTLRKKLDKNDLLSPMVRKKPPTFGEGEADVAVANGQENDGRVESDKGSIPLRLEVEEGTAESGSEVEGDGNGANAEGGVGDDQVREGEGEESGQDSLDTKCNGADAAESEKVNGRFGGVENEGEDEESKDEEGQDEEQDEDEDDDSNSEEDYEGVEDQDEEEDEDEEEEEEDEQQDVFGQKEEPGSDSGCTAVVALMRDNQIVVANAGDSRCVLSKAGEAVDLSIDHKPEDKIEITRIEKAGGKVTPDGRVNGGLNLSRALGDHCYKCNTNLPPEEQMISAFPDIQTAELTKENDFMVIACDGIWNVMTSQEVINFVRERIAKQSSEGKPKLSDICQELFHFCLAPDTSGDGTGCDNMTCIIVQFDHDAPDQPVSVGSKRKASEGATTEENDSKRHKV